ncbi:unnamed protein product [Victoria cruziana]
MSKTCLQSTINVCPEFVLKIEIGRCLDCTEKRKDILDSPLEAKQSKLNCDTYHPQPSATEFVSRLQLSKKSQVSIDIWTADES